MRRMQLHELSQEALVEEAAPEASWLADDCYPITVYPIDKIDPWVFAGS